MRKNKVSWFRTSTDCSKENIDDAFNGLVAQLSLVFSLMLDSLTPSQIAFLQAIACGETQLTSQTVLNTYCLGSSANVTSIKQALEKKEIIDIMPKTINIQDPVFKYWLLTQY